MHKNVLEFINFIKTDLHGLISDATIYDIGSEDPGATLRNEFKGLCHKYVGVDWRAGANVDIVSLAHELQLPDGSVDCFVSTECLEHDPHAEATFANMIRMVKPGGLIAITAAGPTRAVHGQEYVLDGHYQNITLDFFESQRDKFQVFGATNVISLIDGGLDDVQFIGIKRSEPQLDLIDRWNYVAGFAQRCVTNDKKFYCIALSTRL
jgi:SAM-dependent methyltransferase